MIDVKLDSFSSEEEAKVKLVVEATVRNKGVSGADANHVLVLLHENNTPCRVCNNEEGVRLR